MNAAAAVAGAGSEQPYLFTLHSATLAAAAAQPLSPSMLALGVAAESGLRAAAEIPLAITDLGQAGVGAAYTALTGEVLDLNMRSGMGRAAQEGASTKETLHNLNPMLGLMIGIDQALKGLLKGDTLPLAGFSGSLLGGGLAGRATPSLPGYRPGTFSPATARAAQSVADVMPRLSRSEPVVLRAQMGAAGDLDAARAARRIRLVPNPELEQARILHGDASRAKIVATIGEAAQPSIDALRRLDSNARIGFRGSLASGLKGEHKLDVNGNRVAFDGEVAFKLNPKTGQYEPYRGAQGYDADFFVVSNKLANQLGNSKKFMHAADLNSQMLTPIFGAFEKSMH